MTSPKPPRKSDEYWSGTQTGRNTPDLGFFDSDNFQLLESTQERKEERLRQDRVRARYERSRRLPLIDRLYSPELGHYSQLYRNEGNPKPRKVAAPPQTFFGLRRPLNAAEQRVVAAMPAYEKDHKEWVDKPYSTVYTGWKGYDGRYPLLMQLNSESEDKDVTVIQTETRRMSLVTTDYSKGTIKLAGDDEEVKYAVFPLLHRVIESEDEEEDDEDTGSGTDEENDRRPPPLLPQDLLDRLAAIAASSNDAEDSDESGEAEPPPGWLEHKNTRMHAERRLSITTRPCAEKPRMLKRRSLDYGSLFYHHERNELESMGSITEVAEEEPSSPTSIGDDEEETSVPPAGTWARSMMKDSSKSRQSKSAKEREMIRRAEREMEHMDEHLQKLEDFLNRFQDNDGEDGD
ncbi:uncharacterized protein LOC121418062 [Lytechinus variegatus]|uniref:uncharacterized protein LOC121418062 n=1 Tax=Lytechinus variegatus TaxID=7654 RepID=UPI001BB24744|nr:uncharacterized protein LOC121418062 [Lytechinus variegatus]